LILYISSPFFKYEGWSYRRAL